MHYLMFSSEENWRRCNKGQDKRAIAKSECANKVKRTKAEECGNVYANAGANVRVRTLMRKAKVKEKKLPHIPFKLASPPSFFFPHALSRCEAESKELD